jgi:1-acyl-sn-glycerol-3-phosphate acyltransferase
MSTNPPPERHLSVNLDAYKEKGKHALAARLQRTARAFPVVAPSWPDSVPRPVEPSELGVDYDTGWARRYPSRFARLVLTEAVTAPAMRLLADPTVDGLDRIAHVDGPVIFAANHASHLDTPLLLTVLPEPFRYRTVVAGAADYFFDTRLKATLFALSINVIPMERTRVSRKSTRYAIELIQAGWSLLIFPEGGRSPDGWAQPHEPGAAWLAQRTGRPVVPVHVEGTGRILPRHAKRPKPGSTRVAFGRPIDPEGLDRHELADRLERAIEALADEGASDWWQATRRAAQGRSPRLTGPEASGAWRRSWALGAGRRRRPDRRSPAARRRWPD